MAKGTVSAVKASLTDSEKADKKVADFKRLAGNRLQKVLDSMDTLTGTSNVASYTWTKEQAEKICRLVREKLDTLKAALGDGSESIKAAGKGKRVGRSVEL